VEDKLYYIIYRVYSHREGPGNHNIYGWTDSKKILKAFLQQRDEKKYSVRKLTREEIGESYSENDFYYENMISFIRLRSVQTGECIPLFMTMNEMSEVEKKIQKFFIELSSMDKMSVVISGKKSPLYYLNMFIHLDEKYSEALEYIGFRPPELEHIFQPADMTDIDSMIDLAYEGYQDAREYYYEPDNIVPGLSVLEDVSKQILYSLESFIKVMKGDL